MFRVRKGKLILMAAAAGGLLPSFGSAQVRSWTFDGGGTSWTEAWLTDTNWAPNNHPDTVSETAAFVAGDNITGPLRGGTGSVNLTSLVTTGTITMESNGANGYTVAGTGTINLAVDATHGGTINIATGNTGTINTGMTAPTGDFITKSGGGTLVLGGASNFPTVGLQVNGGVVQIANASAMNGISIVATGASGQVLLNNLTTPGTVFGGLGSPSAISALGTSTWTGNMFIVAPSGGIDVQSASTLNLVGSINDGSTQPNSFSKTGAGVLRTNKMQVNGMVTVTGGTLRINAGATPNLAGGLSTIGLNAGSPGSLTISGGGKLDLGNNKLIINYANAAVGTATTATVKGYLTTGFAGGAWNGAGIDTSNGDSTNFALAYVNGNDNPSNFAHGVAANQVEVVYTRYGDLNLDGVVNSADASRFLSFFGKSASRWIDGDLNYDGVVNSADASKFLANFGKGAGFSQSPALGDPLASALFAEIQADAAGAVPEPATTSLMVLGGLSLLGRRDRRRRVS